MLQQRSTVAPGLLAQIIVSKCVHQLPLYRQEQMYWTAHRVWLPRQNLAHWMGLSADWLRPIYRAIRTGVLAGGYVQVDETPVPTATASRPGGNVGYQWQTSRGAACLNSVLPVDFRGTVQCDGYAVIINADARK